jgi:hypothetical protein
MPIKLVRDLPQRQDLSWIELIHEFDLATRAVENAENQRKAIQEKLKARLLTEQLKSQVVDNPLNEDEQLKAVYVANRRLSVDDAKVRVVLGRSFRKVQSEVVDKEKLDAFITTTDDVTKERLTECISITEHPTVRLYHVKRTDDAQEPIE